MLLIADPPATRSTAAAEPLCWFTYQTQGVNPNTDPGGDSDPTIMHKDYSHKPAFSALPAVDGDGDVASARAATAKAFTGRAGAAVPSP